MDNNEISIVEFVEKYIGVELMSSQKWILEQVAKYPRFYKYNKYQNIIWHRYGFIYELYRECMSRLIESSEEE